jgi:signal transduction histidine kinase
VPEVTSCAGRIASTQGKPQHGGMHEFFRELRQPMNLAGLFTLAAVGLSLRFLPLPQLIVAAALLAAFSVLFVVISAGSEHWRRTRLVSLLLMPAVALALTWYMPRLGTAQVLLVVWTAVAFSVWPPKLAAPLVLLADVVFYLLLLQADLNSPLTMVLINLGFQALAGLCVYYARNAELTRDQLALVNADLLATRALLADSARDSERLRVARELHDVAGHKLTAMKLNLRALAAEPDLAEREEVRTAQQLASDLLDDIRNVVQALRDARGLDLDTALRALAAPLPKPVLKLHIDEQVKIADPVQAETILRLVQEALTNSARHADAATLSVDVRREGNDVLLRIEDDGRLQGRLREGNGIAGMRERIDAVRGSLRLDTTPQGGLRIEARLPT